METPGCLRAAAGQGLLKYSCVEATDEQRDEEGEGSERTVAPG